MRFHVCTAGETEDGMIRVDAVGDRFVRGQVGFRVGSDAGGVEGGGEASVEGRDRRALMDGHMEESEEAEWWMDG